MRKSLMVVMLTVFLLVFCGAPQETPKAEAEKPAEKAGADMYYSQLSESELMRFIKAFPTFRTEMEKAGKDWESTEGPDAFMAMMGQYSMLHKELPELDAKLKAAGMSWNEFMPAMGKTFMSIAAVFVDSAMMAMKEQTKGMEGDMAKEMMKSMEEANAAYKDVPQVNKDLVRKHLKDLEAVLDVD